MKALPPAMSNQGIGLSKFISNPSAITKAMGIPASQQTVDVSATDVTVALTSTVCLSLIHI